MSKVEIQEGVLIEQLPSSIGIEFTVWSNKFSLKPAAVIKLVEFLEEIVKDER